MITRMVLALGAVLGIAGPAAAGGSACGGDCYRETTLPPVYGTVSERVLLRGPRTYDVVTPGEYRQVAETVVVAPARREWRVTRDAWGRRVGCWVDLPAEYAVRHRTVMVRAPESVPHTIGAVYGVSHRSVLVEPAHRAWLPLGGGAFGHRGGYED